MRILIIHQFLWAHYKAGIFNKLYSLCKEKGDEFYVLQTSLFEEARKDFGMPDRSLHQYPYKLLFEGIYEETGFWNRVKACIKEIKEFKPDVINIPGYYDMAMMMVMIWARSKGIKIVLSNDSTAADNSRNKLKEGFKKWLVSFADGFFCYGTASARYIMQLGAQPEQILLKRNSVNNNLVRMVFEQARKESQDRKNHLGLRPYNFIFVGRFLEIKNLKRLISAFESLKNNIDWGLILMGEGPMRNEIERAGAPGISFLAPSDWKGVAQNMALANVLVLPSYSEPWGLVVNEAMICGLPVIVSEQSGSSADLVKDGLNGFIFDAFGEDILTEKLQFFVDSPDSVEKMGEASLSIIAEFSPEMVAKEMYDGFKALLS